MSQLIPGLVSSIGGIASHAKVSGQISTPVASVASAPLNVPSSPLLGGDLSSLISLGQNLDTIGVTLIHNNVGGGSGGSGGNKKKLPIPDVLSNISTDHAKQAILNALGVS